MPRFDFVRTFLDKKFTIFVRGGKGGTEDKKAENLVNSERKNSTSTIEYVYTYVLKKKLGVQTCNSISVKEKRNIFFLTLSGLHLCLLAFVKKQQSRMPLGAEAIRAPAIAEASTGITLSRDPAVEGQQPASMRRQDLRVDTAV